MRKRLLPKHLSGNLDTAQGKLENKVDDHIIMTIEGRQTDNGSNITLPM
jgi:hypothetical protein